MQGWITRLPTRGTYCTMIAASRLISSIASAPHRSTGNLARSLLLALVSHCILFNLLLRLLPCLTFGLAHQKIKQEIPAGRLICGDKNGYLAGLFMAVSPLCHWQLVYGYLITSSSPASSFSFIWLGLSSFSWFLIWSLWKYKIYIRPPVRYRHTEATICFGQHSPAIQSAVK